MIIPFLLQHFLLLPGIKKIFICLLEEQYVFLTSADDVLTQSTLTYNINNAFNIQSNNKKIFAILFRVDSVQKYPAQNFKQRCD